MKVNEADGDEQGMEEMKMYSLVNQIIVGEYDMRTERWICLNVVAVESGWEPRQNKPRFGEFWCYMSEIQGKEWGVMWEKDEAESGM